MPNEILQEMKDWLEAGDIKSVQHQEFVYSYYWLMVYLWRYAVYAEEKITQATIKELLGYNPTEKRLNYLIKKGGVLDQKEYTYSGSDYPISWKKKGTEEIQFTMLTDLNDEFRDHINKFTSGNVVVKEPLKHTGNGEEAEGVYWNTPNTHAVESHVFNLCMRRGLGCSSFYVYGILRFIENKSNRDVLGEEFPCANDTLVEFTGWSVKKIQSVTGNLKSLGLIKKEQITKSKGNVNIYRLI